MTKHIIAATFLALATTGAWARSATEVFVNAPDTIVPLFTKTQRMDMADYFTYSLPTQVTNRLGGSSRIVEANPAAIMVQVGPASQLQLAVLPLRGDTLVAVIETVLTPQADSGVRFYRLSDWSPVAPENTIGMADFVVGSTSDLPADMPAMFFCQIHYDGINSHFVFTNTTRGYYTPGETPAGLDRLAGTVTATFDGRRWRKTKH